MTGSLTLEMVKIAEIKMFPSNAKIHSQKHIDKIVKSIKEFGFKQLILITTDSFIIAGHYRYTVGKKLGFPVYKKHLEGSYKMKTIKIIIDNEEIKTIKVNDQDIDIFLKIIEVFKEA